MAEAIVRLEGVRKDYGKLTAIRHLDLEVEAGECFGFLGPNGAGKTTTIKMLAGLLIPTGGRVLIAGHDIQREPEKAKAVIGFVPDKPFIYEKLTGREFLDFMLDLYDVAKASAESRRRELLEMFALTEWQDELVEKLLNRAILKVFDQHFSVNSLQKVIDYFNSGWGVEVSDAMPSEDYLEGIKEIPGLRESIRSLGSMESPALMASATEFILEGLHLHQKLNKEVEGGRITYGK